ncbi:hypothetical protein CF15_00425 [Pyrodictium occultum]|uniref:Uncharacterized protein n=1 Tax=Pyrodictium occultum TaxID=2309 RepID=A0A0V8RTI1_PYROC|nr:hypothetical protein [Pyrodictium occultum]KSW11369.1 hypothetical protein CF15_00425 [Pyrodictium occultum]
MHSLQRRQRRLEAVNQLLLPLLRGARRYYTAWRLVNPLLTGVSRVDESSDYTVTVVTLQLPASSPLVVALYTSTQESRPISPSQLQRRIRRLRSRVASLRGKVFNRADLVYIIYAPRGFTVGARRMARREAVNLASRIEDAIKALARFVGRRLARLTEKLRGRRIWGEVPLLLYALQELTVSLGAGARLVSRELAVKLAERGGTI